MVYTEEEQYEVHWAWNLYKTTEQLQLILLQKFHQDFIYKMEKEYDLKEREIQLPF